MEKIIPIRFPVELWRAIQAAARRQGLAASSWIRVVVIRELRLLEGNG